MENTANCTLLKKYKNQNGKFNVKLCIYINQERHYLGTHFNLTEEEWGKLNHTPLKDSKLIEIRNSIRKIETAARTVLKKDDLLTFDQFEEYYYDEINEIHKDNDVFHWFDEYYKFLVSSNRPTSYCDHILTSKNKLKKFKTKITFSQLNVEFLENFREWMKSDIKKHSSDSYLRDLRTVYNFAIKKKGVSKVRYPFGHSGFTIGSSISRKNALSKQQVISLKDYNFVEKSKLDWARDIFIFQYFSNGLNIVDLCKLKENQIEISDGGTFINFDRTKTQRTKENSKRIRLCLNQETVRIIEKWGNPNRSKDDYVFPFFNTLKSLSSKEKNLMERKVVGYVTRNINRQLAQISKLLDFKFAFTTGIARHTFATVLKNEGYSTAIIGESLGHTNPNTTTIYLDSIGDDQIIEISKSLS